jgi:Ca-activated chloride channel family protein
MNLLWPSSLTLLLLLPVLVAVYIWLQRRRRRYAVRFSSLSLIRAALPAQSRLRRHLPFAALLLAFASLVFSFSRPVAVTQVPAGRATVMLALDVSSSMRQTDILPSRFEAARQAALSFVDRQAKNNQIGIVAFSGIAQLVQSPTIDSEQLELVIMHLTTGRGTAIGSAILAGLDTIAEFNPDVKAKIAAAEVSGEQITPDAEGELEPDIIVLLTDGVYTTGPDPLDAAQQAVDLGVRVYTIGFGTHNISAGGQDRNNAQGFGGGFNREIDEESLKEIAAMTGGEYYAASSAGELQKVFESLPTYLITKEETIEISVLFVALGAVLLIAAVTLSQLWHPLP